MINEQQKADRKIMEKFSLVGEDGITKEDISKYIKVYVLDCDDTIYEDDYEFYDTAVFCWHSDILGWCNCGVREKADKAVLDYLNTMHYTNGLCRTSNPTADIHNIYGGLDDPLLLCLMYTLEDKGLTEHRSSVYGSWLTTKGFVMRLCLRRFFKLAEEMKNENA